MKRWKLILLLLVLAAGLTIGAGVSSDFELNFGRHLPTFGRADDDATDKQPGRSSPWIQLDIVWECAKLRELA
jgi:hypothetical protein